jgi:hypothetical protein
MQTRGPPGTWELSCSPRERDAAGGVEQVVLADGKGVRAVGAKGAQRGVRRNEGNEVKPDGVREVGVR